MEASQIILFVAVAVYAALGLIAVRYRLLARVALREAIRRPVQTILVVAGLSVGTGAILGPVVWGDSLTNSLITAASRSWGRVDITVSAGGAPITSEVAERLTADLATTSSVAGVQAGLDLMGSVSNPAQSANHPAVRLVGFDPATQEAFGAFVLEDGTRTYGEGLAPRQVILSRSLARAIHAGAGDHVSVAVDGGSVDLTVAGVARPEEGGLYGLRPALFAPLATATTFAGSGRINVVRITAAGDGPAEEAAAKEAAPVVRAKLANLTSSLVSGQTLEV